MVVKPTCAAVSVPNTNWSFCPSTGAAIVLTVCFFIVFVLHLVQGIYYKKVYTWVLAMGALWQFIAYVLRIVSIQNPTNLGDFAGWFVLILVAPLWTNAFVFMVIARMMWNFVPGSRVFKVKAWRFGQLFVLLDIVAFNIQVYGAASATGTDNHILAGIHIYMAGVAIQELFILFVLVFAVQLHRVLLQQRSNSNPIRPYNNITSALQLLYALYVVVFLITLRICFRLVEYSDGLESTIPNHEVYQYCLDSLPMLLAFIVLNVIHPGRIMRGKASDLPTRKERKARQGGDEVASPMVEQEVTVNV